MGNCCLKKYPDVDSQINNNKCCPSSTCCSDFDDDCRWTCCLIVINKNGTSGKSRLNLQIQQPSPVNIQTETDIKK